MTLPPPKFLWLVKEREEVELLYFSPSRNAEPAFVNSTMDAWMKWPRGREGGYRRPLTKADLSDAASKCPNCQLQTPTRSPRMDISTDQLWAPSTDHFSRRPTGNLVARWLGWASSVLEGLWLISTGINIHSGYGIAVPALRASASITLRILRNAWSTGMESHTTATKAFNLQWRRCVIRSYHIKPHPEASCGGIEKLLKNTAEVPTWRQDPARIGNYLSGCSICIGSENLMWCFITNRKNTQVPEIRGCKK